MRFQLISGDLQKSANGRIVPILLCAHEELLDNCSCCHGNPYMSYRFVLSPF